MGNETNILNIHKADKEFISAFVTLQPDELILIKGIIIGLQLQEQQQINKVLQNDQEVKL